MIFKSATILTERKYVTSDSGLETSSDSDTLDSDMEVEERFGERVADEEWLKNSKSKE